MHGSQVACSPLYVWVSWDKNIPPPMNILSSKKGQTTSWLCRSYILLLILSLQNIFPNSTSPTYNLLVKIWQNIKYPVRISLERFSRTGSQTWLCIRIMCCIYNRQESKTDFCFLLLSFCFSRICIVSLLALVRSLAWDYTTKDKALKEGFSGAGAMSQR